MSRPRLHTELASVKVSDVALAAAREYALTCDIPVGAALSRLVAAGLSEIRSAVAPGERALVRGSAHGGGSAYEVRIGFSALEDAKAFLENIK